MKLRKQRPDDAPPTPDSENAPEPASSGSGGSLISGVIRPRTDQTESQAVGGGVDTMLSTAILDAPFEDKIEKTRRLGDLLIERDLVNHAQLAEALLQQSSTGKRLGALLVELGALDERQLASILSAQLNIPLIDLRQATPDAQVVAEFPETIARAMTAIPIRRRADGTVEIAVGDPSDADMRAQLTKSAGGKVAFYVASTADIKRAIDNSYRALSMVGSHVEAFQAAEAVRKVAVQSLDTVVEDAPVVQVVTLVVAQALRDRASDIHIEPQDTRVRVRYRIDGALHDVLELPVTMANALVSRIKIMAGMNIVERRRSQDGQFATSVDGREVDVRVATTATIWGEKAVLRLLDKSRNLFKIQDLGMPRASHKVFSELIHSPFGMVICTGPTGSGKTTTLYATLTEINDAERNIMTIEDPVEYVFPSINQIQINEQAGVTFAGGLKAILRQDPDVILVGEVRDAETARIAIQSALTGHFVLSSLHATDAAAGLHRFLDMGIESFLIASSVLAVVGQRLVRRTCMHCKVRYRPSPDEMAFYESAGGEPKDHFYVGEGCAFCSRTGYQERIGVYEVLRVTDEIKNLIVTNAPHEDIKTMAVLQGMSSMRQEGARLVAEDVTTIAEIMRSIYTL